MLFTTIVLLGTTTRLNALFDVADVRHLFPPARHTVFTGNSECVGKVVPVPKSPTKVIIATGKTGMHLMPMHKNELTCILWSRCDGTVTNYDEKVKVLQSTQSWFNRVTPSGDGVLRAVLADAEDFMAWSSIESSA